MSVESYISSLERLEKAIKQYDTELKKLRDQRKEMKKYLLEAMIVYRKEKAGKYTRKKLESELNRQTYKRAPVKQRKEMSIQELKRAGIPNPENFYDKLVQINKAKRE